MQANKTGITRGIKTVPQYTSFIWLANHTVKGVNQR